jgi:hypothetical protein
MILRKSTLLGILIWLLSQSIVSGQPLPLVQFTVSSGQGLQGSKICLDVSVSDFTNVESMQLNLSFNASLIRLDSVDITKSALGVGNISLTDFNLLSKANGFIKLVWTNNPTTLPDNSLLFSVCFTLIGNPGNISPIYFNGQLLDVELCQVQNNGISTCTDEIISNTGTIKIISNTLDAFVNKCDADTNNIPAGGSVTFYATGGTPPYNYTINPGGYNGPINLDGQRVTIPNLPPGNYTLNVSDSGGSPVAIKSFNISDNLPITVDSSSIQKPTCFNRRNGSVDLFISGGQAPYRYEWSNLISGLKKIDDLPPAKYAVTITDVSGCQIQRNFDLEVDTLKFDVAIKDTASCLNIRNGIITISNVSGENPWTGLFNYTYTINNIGNPKQFLNTVDVENIGSGNVRVTVQDRLGCNVERTLFMPFKKTVSIDTLLIKDISCFGIQDGEIRLRAKPGVGYSYAVNPFTIGGTLGGVFILDDMAKGTYQVTARDGAGCTGVATFELKEPNPIVLNPTVVQPDCVNPGSITLNPTGGTGAYTYTWNPPAAGNVNALTGLSGGSYTVSVTDANNCTATPFSVQLNPQGALDITTIIKQPVSCAGKNDAVVIVEIGSANGPFNVTWRNATNNVISNMTQVSNLGPGVYTVEVSDKNNCSNSKTVTIDPGNDFNLTTTLSKAPCFNQNGKVEASVSGNSAGFKYEWRVKGQSAVIDMDNILDAKAGTYTVKVISPAGCEKEADVTITEANQVLLNQPDRINNEHCKGANRGSAVYLNLSGEYKLTWSNLSSDRFILGPDGQYWVFATDTLSGCKSDTVKFTIGINPPLVLNSNKTQIVNPTCFGDNNGSIFVESTGGANDGYKYNWNNGSTLQTIANLSAGLYIITISDIHNCTQTDTFRLTQPDELIASLDKSKSVELDCNNQVGGKLALMTTGGNQGIKTITWQAGVSTSGNTAIDLNPGTYCATISDNFGCRDTFCYTLIAPAPLVGELDIPAEPQCFGDKTCISVKSISGGTGNKYTFQIVTGGIRYPLDSCVSVFAGKYNVILIDSAGCDIRKEITIGQPNPITVELGDDVEIQLGLPTPTISASITDNVGVTQLAWTPMEGITCLTTDCEDIEANPTETTTYLLTVTDQNGCTGTDRVTVNVKNLRNVYFANAFSPNDDGFNDHFQAVIGPGVEKILTFTIYDRWGGQVFLKENYVPDPALTDGWNGTFGNTGRKLDPGVFVYFAIARFIDGKEIEYTGTVTLMDKTRN